MDEKTRTNGRKTEIKEDMFEIETAYMRISFSVHTTLAKDEYGIYQIWY